MNYLVSGGGMDGSSAMMNDANKQNDGQQNMQTSQQTSGPMGMPPYGPGMPMQGYPGPFPPMMGMRPPPGMPGQYVVCRT